MQRIASGDAELARRLLAYADEQLSPNETAVARMRARVMREARVVLEAPSQPVAQPTAIRRRSVAPGLRRTASLVLAAALSLVAIGGTALAAAPGGPLYGAALWVEELTLPSGGEARLTADIGRLERRLAEAVSEANAGDQAGMQAALTAYRAAVEHAMGAAGTNEDWLARLEAALAQHQTILLGVLGKVPEQAKEAIQQAIDKSDNAIDRIGAPGGPSGPGGPSEPGGPGGPSEPGGPGGPGGPGEPGQPSQVPARTAPPNPTPRDPDPTRRPERTPPVEQPRPSQARAGGD